MAIQGLFNLLIEVKVKFLQVFVKGTLKVLNDCLTSDRILPLVLQISKALTKDRHNGNLRTKDQTCPESRKTHKKIAMLEVSRL